MTEPYHKQQTQKLNEAAASVTPASAVEGKLPARLKGTSGQELLKEVLAVLRAQSWHLQSLHWKVKGSDFYELHLLFERLYGGLGDEIDTLAEKLVGYFGSEAVSMDDSMTRAHKWIKEWKGEPVAAALAAEKHIQAVLRHAYETLSEANELSLGLDDYLMAIANAHETHLYLLGQI